MMKNVKYTLQKLKVSDTKGSRLLNAKKDLLFCPIGFAKD